MRIRIRSTTLDGRPIPEGGRVFEGNTFVDVVEAMRATASFADRPSLAGYMAGVRKHVRSLLGVTITTHGTSRQERAGSFLAQLVAAGLAEMLPEDEEPAPPVVVPPVVLEGLEAVRRSGLTNMLDRPAVARLADEFDFPEAAEWVRRHRDRYAEGVFRGFAANDEEGK